MAYFFVNLISLCFSVQFKVMSELLTNMHHYLEIAEHFYQARKFSAWNVKSIYDFVNNKYDIRMHIHLLVHYVGKYVNCWYNGPTCCWLWSGVSTAQWSYIRSINSRLALDYSHIAINLNSNMTHNILVILNIKQTWSWLMDEKQIFYTRSLNILIFPPHPPHFLVIQGISIKMFQYLSVLCDLKNQVKVQSTSCLLNMIKVLAQKSVEKDTYPCSKC